MITIPGSINRSCDGISRREFLQIGGLVVARSPDRATLADRRSPESRCRREAEAISWGQSERRVIQAVDR